MPEICSCGAQLPPDAVFCHKCGKPQREVAAVEPETSVPSPAPVVATPPMEPASVDFRNRDALITALIGAGMAVLLWFLLPVSCLVAGYFAVYFYRRRTRQSVNAIVGVRIGWLTGLMTFAVCAIMILGSVLVLHMPGVMESIKEQAQNDARLQPFVGMVQNARQNTAEVLYGVLPRFFVLSNFLSMTGGLLGAMLTGRINPRPPGGNTV